MTNRIFLPLMGFFLSILFVFSTNAQTITFCQSTTNTDAEYQNCLSGISGETQEVEITPEEIIPTEPLVNQQCYEIDLVFKEDCLRTIYKKPSGVNPTAQQVVTLFENTLASNFTSEMNVNLQVNGSFDDDYSPQTEFDVSYSSGDSTLRKNNNAYHIDMGTEQASVWFDQEETESDFLPFHVNMSWTEEAIMNFDTFQFAGKFDIFDIDYHNNKSVQNIAEGMLEFAELFEDKWIVLDFLELEEEFPELMAEFADMKEDILDDAGQINGYSEFVWILSEGIEQGYIQVTKKGNEYILMINNYEEIDEYDDSSETLTNNSNNPLQLIITTSNNKIETIEVNGGFNAMTSGWDETDITFSSDTTIDFTYNTPTITFPTITANDWEITNIMEMVMEFTKQDIQEQAADNKFYQSILDAEFTAETALTYIQENGTKTDAEFAATYAQNANEFNRRIRKQDLNILTGYGYNIDEWTIDYLYREIAYNPYDGEYDDYGYDNKYLVENFIEIFTDADYVYFPWEVYDQNPSALNVKSRGDILILLAKIRYAENMRDAE